MTTLRQSIETYILAKDGNRPHLMPRAFAADAELVMDVKTEAISFPSTTKGVKGISDVLVSQFAQRYENIYTFCMTVPPEDASGFSCDWLVCMTEKLSGAMRLGYGRYEWSCASDAGKVSRLKITIEEMANLASEWSDPVLQWASALPYPWCPPDLPLASVPDVPVARNIAEKLRRNST